MTKDYWIKSLAVAYGEYRIARNADNWHLAALWGERLLEAQIALGVEIEDNEYLRELIGLELTNV
jgi:hypothetical protein